MSELEEYDYHKNKRPDKTYVSRSLSFSEQKNEWIKVLYPDSVVENYRIGSKVIDSEQGHIFVKEHDELVIRVTSGSRQEVVAKFYEDTRGIFTLTIQRFEVQKGTPHKYSFSFVGEEISRFRRFLDDLDVIPLEKDNSVNVTDAELQRAILNDAQTTRLFAQNQDKIVQFLKSNATQQDIVAIGYRRQQLEAYEKLLNDPDYFEMVKRDKETSNEGVWQAFFEKNKWIFGYGLTYLFISSLDDKKLEQVVSGFDIESGGKRADAVMKTRGLISALCLVEIKTHETQLLGRQYRTDCWAPSAELAGSIAQVQGTVSSASENLHGRITLSDAQGDPTGEDVFLFHPRSFLVVGSLDEFRTDHGINEAKFRSFELLRRNTTCPTEVLTFDELYERARFIVEHYQ